MKETGQAVRTTGERQTERQGTPGPSRALSFRHRKLLSQFLQSLSHSLAEGHFCLLGFKRSMFDCMEALGLAPRPLFDVSGQGSCMLAKATPYFSGLDPFAWASASSVLCEYSILSIKSSYVCVFLSESWFCYHRALSPQEESDSFRFCVPILTLLFVCLCA